MNPEISASIGSLIWITFIVVWIVAAFSMKRTVRRLNPSFWVFRIVVIVLVIFAIKQSNGNLWWNPSFSPALELVGLVLMVLGVALAFWARFYLASNWGTPMSIKENTELVTTGPYAYIRNPIYTGILVMMLGSGFALGAWWFPLAVFSLCFLIYAAKKEEGIMLSAFPDTYPAYKARTKMLIPWII